MKPVRWSLLKQMSVSPAHYQLAAAEGGRRDTPAMRLGRAVDSLLFGGDHPVIYPGARRGNEWQEFSMAHRGVEIVTGDEYETASRMVEAIEGCPLAWRALEGQRYARIEWKWLGRDCLSHPDVLGSGHITDLKTGVSSEPHRFRRQALRFGYHTQLAFYRLAARFMGMDPQEAYIVAVESTPPYPVTVFQLTPRALDAGERLCREWMERLLECEASGEFPGYAEAMVPFDVEDFEEESELVALAS